MSIGTTLLSNLNSKKLNPLAGGIALTAMTMIFWGLMSLEFRQSQKATIKTAAPDRPNIPPLVGIPLLEHDAQWFFAITSSIENAAECIPTHLRANQNLGIMYLFCSNEALMHDGRSVVISDNFSVPKRLARRYNFWRRIYSLWDKDQYVLHLSAYPEVVVEVYDASGVSSTMSPALVDRKVKDLAKEQKRYYRQMFKAMHEHRYETHRFTPAMKRMARLMAHIPDRDKYRVASYSMRIQRGQRDFISNGLTVAPKYLPHIEREFAAQEIPIEIAKLAFVESSFNLKAQSKAGASGVYQIMPATGRQYLKIRSGIDERNDPIKAGRAAAKLLKLNYNLTGSWPLAITAYNHGVGSIRRAIRHTGSTDIVAIIERYDHKTFGFASKNFYASFLGILATLKEGHRIFPEIPRVTPLAFERVRLDQATSVKTIKRRHHVTTSELVELNPDISPRVLWRSGVLPRGYVIKIPAHAADSGSTEAVAVSPPPNS